MTVNSFDLYLANRIQEKERISIDQLTNRTNRSAATIRRSIHSLNEFLPTANQFIITESTVISQLSYQTLVQVIQSLTLADFVTSVEERYDYLITSSILNSSINLSNIYDTLLISQSTKKRDRSFFLEELAKKQLVLESIRGKGITINGDELNLRILAAQIISKVIEINEDNQIIPRKANNPLQNLIYDQVAHIFLGSTNKKLAQFLKKNKLSFNYTGSKFLYVYTYLSDYRISKEQLITRKTDFLAFPPNFDFFSISDEENFSFSSVLSSLDNDGETIYQKSEQIQEFSKQLIDYIEHRIITTFYTKDSLSQAIEQYLYKCIFRNGLGFDFYDNKLDDVKKEFSFLYQLIEYFYDTTLSDQLFLDTYQLSTITLLFREHVLKNKISGRNQKKIVIVTNSAKEKSDFFAQQLTYYFDTKVISYINIQEIHHLKLLKFDNLITFSNRISSILNEQGYPNIKLNYYFHDEDIQYLTKLNFSLNSHRKLVATDFVNEISQIPPEQLPLFLKENYPNFFV